MRCRMKDASGFTLIELLVVIGIIGLVAALLFPVFARAREQARAAACLSNIKQLGLAIELYLGDYDDTYPMNRFPDATHSLTGCLSPGTSLLSDGLDGSSVNWKRVILPYVKNRAVWECPSNPDLWGTDFVTGVPGDETNLYYSPKERLPNSYAYNGSFFNQAVPPCWYGEPLARPRRLAEIHAPSSLILLVESRSSYSDMGDWYIPARIPRGGSSGPFQSHNGGCNWLFADGHARRLKLAATCREKMWTDTYADKSDGCLRLDESADEYR